MDPKKTSISFAKDGFEPLAEMVGTLDLTGLGQSQLAPCGG